MVHSPTPTSKTNLRQLSTIPCDFKHDFFKVLQHMRNCNKTKIVFNDRHIHVSIQNLVLFHG